MSLTTLKLCATAFWHQQYKNDTVVVKGFTTFFTLGKASDQSEDRWLGTDDVFRGRSPADRGEQPEPWEFAAFLFFSCRNFAWALCFRLHFLYLAITPARRRRFKPQSIGA